MIYQLRRLVQEGNLLAFNDTRGRTRDEIAAVYAAARDNVLTQLSHRRSAAESTGLPATA